MDTEKPEGRGRGYRVTKEANQAQDAWEQSIADAITDMDQRIGELEAANDGGDTTGDTG